MKKALLYSMSLVLALSLVACGHDQTDQQISEPDPATASSQADASTPEPGNIQQIKQVGAGDKAGDTEQQELSGDTLLEYFKLAYEGSSSYTSGMDTEESIQFELEVLRARVFYDNVRLPYDYEAQYREWRPKDTPPAPAIEESSKQKVEQQKVDQQQVEQQQVEQQQEVATQQSEPKVNTDTQVTQQSNSSTSTYVDEEGRPVDENGLGIDRYHGFSTYTEWIDSLQQKYPDISRSELEKKFPDTATGYVEQEVLEQSYKDNVLGHHN